MNVNKVFLAGRLCADPLLKYLPSQSAVVNLRVATNRKWKTEKGESRDEVVYWDIVAFGKLAELLNQHFSKGREIYIEGRGKLDVWEDKNGGGKRSKFTVVAESFQFVGSKPDGGGSSQNAGAKPPFKEDDAPQFTDDDVPF